MLIIIVRIVMIVIMLRAMRRRLSYKKIGRMVHNSILTCCRDPTLASIDIGAAVGIDDF